MTGITGWLKQSHLASDDMAEMNAVTKSPDHLRQRPAVSKEQVFDILPFDLFDGTLVRCDQIKVKRGFAQRLSDPEDLIRK